LTKLLQKYNGAVFCLT